MRALSEDKQDKILQKVKSVLRGSGFRFRDAWASVMGGIEEGAFAWISANYQSSGFDSGKPLETNGVVDLGGASLQIAYVPKHGNSDTNVLVRLGDVEYSLAVYTFQEFGFDSFRGQVFKAIGAAAE